MSLLSRAKVIGKIQFHSIEELAQACQYFLIDRAVFAGSVPWKHYTLATTEVVLNSLVIPSYNSSNNPKLLQPCSMDLFYNNALVSSHPYSATVLNVPSLSYFDMFYDYGNTLSLASAVNDTFVDFDFRYYLSTNTTPERLSENDTN